MILMLKGMLAKETAETENKATKKRLFDMLLDRLGANLFGNIFTHGKGAIFRFSERYFVRSLTPLQTTKIEIQKF